MFNSLSKGTVIKIILPENPTVNDNCEITPEFFGRLKDHYCVENRGTNPSYFFVPYKIKNKLFNHIHNGAYFFAFVSLGDSKAIIRIEGFLIMESYDLKDNEIIIC